jgi:hypothetical protein
MDAMANSFEKYQITDSYNIYDGDTDEISMTELAPFMLDITNDEIPNVLPPRKKERRRSVDKQDPARFTLKAAKARREKELLDLRRERNRSISGLRKIQSAGENGKLKRNSIGSGSPIIYGTLDEMFPICNDEDLEDQKNSDYFTSHPSMAEIGSGSNYSLMSKSTTDSDSRCKTRFDFSTASSNMVSRVSSLPDLSTLRYNASSLLLPPRIESHTEDDHNNVNEENYLCVGKSQEKLMMPKNYISEDGHFPAKDNYLDSKKTQFFFLGFSSGASLQ